MKTYIKPDVEYVEFATEVIANTDVVSGESNEVV